MRALKFPPRYLFTCSVGRSRSKARYSLNGSNDVGTLLESMIHQGLGDQGEDESTHGPALHLNAFRDHSRDGSGGLGLSGGGAGGLLSGSTTSSSGGGAFVASPPGFSRGHSGVLGTTGSSQEAIMRAIEAASAARVPGSRRASGDQGFVSQGSLQGFAREDALIGSSLGWQQQQQGAAGVGAAAGAGVGVGGPPVQQQQQLLQRGRGGAVVHTQQHLQQQHLDQLAQQEEERVEEAVGLSWHAASSSPDIASSPVSGSRHQQSQSLLQQHLAQQALARSRQQQQQRPHQGRHSG